MKRASFKIWCLALVLSVIAGSVPAFASYSDVYDYDSYYGAVDRLGGLGILNGYTDGAFHPSDALTRAQFAKIVVCAMDKEDEASAVSSPFYDVPQGHWALPYINYVTANGIIVGYSDGSFRPDEKINYAEALTVLIRMLGYTEADVGYFWPNNYMDKAAALGFTDEFYRNSTDAINRAEAAVLVDRALFTDVKGSTDTIFLATVGYTVKEDSMILGTSDNDDTLQWDEVRLSDSSVYRYKTSGGFEPASFAKYLVIDNDDNTVAAAYGVLTGNQGADEMKRAGYTVVDNCYIIASASDDRTLASDEIRTTQGVFKVQDTDVLAKTEEVGTLVLDKNRKVISASTKEANTKEYIVTKVNGSQVEYVSDSSIQSVSLNEDFPIYADYGARETFSKAVSDFVAGSKLTLYANGDENWAYGVVDTGSGYSVLTDCFLIASKTEDKTLTSDQVRTSNGVYQVKSNDILNKIGEMGTVVLDESKKIEQFAPASAASLSVVVNRVANGVMEYMDENGNNGSFRFSNTFKTYVDYSTVMQGIPSEYVNAGDSLTLYGDSYGDWSFAVVESGTDIDPILATKDYTQADEYLGSIKINKNSLKVYRNGLASSLSEIKRNDVVYYNQKANIMDVYDNKVTGIYYEALPSKAYVSSVMVGGKEYELGTTQAVASLDESSGSFQIGDRVTLLLGKNDKVAFAVQLSDFDFFEYGVVLGTYTETKQSGTDAGKSEIKAKLFMPDGNTYEYVTDRDYKLYKGQLVKLNFADGIVSMQSAGSTKAYGEIDKANRTIGDKTVLKDAVVMQLVSNEDGQDAEVTLLNFDTLGASKISSSQLLSSVSANKFGDVGILYVKDLVATDYRYGMLTQRKTEGGMGTYTIQTGGEKQTFTSSVIYSVTSGNPVAVRTSGGQLKDMKQLYLYASANDIEAVDGSRIKLNGKVYAIGADAMYYRQTGMNQYEALSYSEVENMQVDSVSVYSDKPVSSGGEVKLVLIQ
jgi:hypothetical protein